MLDYYKGMDISFLQEYLEKGMKTYDLDGTLIDPLKLAKKHGVNILAVDCDVTENSIDIRDYVKVKI